jgi:hypothetical protein
MSTIVLIILVTVGFNMSMRRFNDFKLELASASGYPELHETEMNGQSKLERYEAQADGTYRIPIERAMELEARDAE